MLYFDPSTDDDTIKL